ncbi:glycosyltransferase family 2 protein, partial [Escherichia coli]|nr:glycosyltransferase family 2 protein [Escherichia coli]
MTILFSVITPTYNRADELSSLFKSLNNQEGIEFEWVIIDDGSEDHTQQQVNDFKKHNKNITDIKYFYQENKGKNSAVIRGIQNASGDYIVVIDSDDYLLDD